MDVQNLIQPELLILVPVLSLIGVLLKRSRLPDRFIPHGPVRRLRDDVHLNVPGISAALEELFSQTD